MKALFKDFIYYEEAYLCEENLRDEFFKELENQGWEINHHNECLQSYFEVNKEFNVNDVVKLNGYYVVKLNGYYAVIEHKSYDLVNEIFEYILREE